jgi:hypothetical protein
MKKSCPRCKSVFECEARSGQHCFCADVELSNDTRAFLAKTYYDCLCGNCLKELDELVRKTRETPFDPKIKNLKEGEYYYQENGRIVLTEMYHIAKGSCCQSGCRHCAYGFAQMFGLSQ